MPEFKTPTCDNGHQSTEMTFLESYDPLAQPSCGISDACTEWRQRWRYACPECCRIVEISERPGENFVEKTVRKSNKTTLDDSTSLNPVKK